MTDYYYFDTCPLLRWAERRAGDTQSRCVSIAEETESIINSTENISAISEITLIEFHNYLCIWERDTAKASYTQQWADDTWLALMQWIMDDRLIVKNQPPKLVESALTYIKYATREKGRGFKAWDATHLFQAYCWARELNSIVFFVTTDEGFRRILDDYPVFSKYVIRCDPLLKVSYLPPYK